MRTRTRLPLVLALVAASAVHAGVLEPGSPRQAGLSPRGLEALSAELQGYVDAGRVAGSVALVARNGKIAYHEAFGQRDREAESPMQTDTIFRIASQTKAIVTAAVMTLQEQGLLSTSDPVGKYLPEYLETTVAVPVGDGDGYDIVPAARPITVHDLLTHTSGFGYGTGVAEDRWREAGIQGWYFAERSEPAAATVARMASLPADAQPGAEWVYGYSTDILGVLVEQVAGVPLDEYLDEHILRPLGMTDTHFYLPPAKRDRLAAVYAAAEGGIVRAPESGGEGQGAYVDGPRMSLSGGAGLLSTAEDYARFLQMLLDGGELDGRRILTRESVELMTSNQIGEMFFDDGESFGLGFYVVEDAEARSIPGSVGEFGWGGAYHSTYWVDPAEQLVVVYLTQLIPTGDIDDDEKLRERVYEAIVD